MHISEKIKFIRTKILNVSAQKFADMCGVTARTVYAWESGVSLPCLDNIVAIANTCHASLDYLLIDNHEFELCFPNLDDIYKFLALYFPLFFIHLVYFMFSYFLVFDHFLFN